MSMEHEDWYDDDDRPADPTGDTLTIENEDGDEITLTVDSADYEPADPSVGIMSGGWSGVLCDGRDVTFEGRDVIDDKGRFIGTLD